MGNVPLQSRLIRSSSARSRKHAASTSPTQMKQDSRKESSANSVISIKMNSIVAEESLLHTARETETIITEFVNKEHITIHNLLRPGQLLKWMDVCACLSAEKHAGVASVTATMDDVQFSRPIRLGELLTLQGKVTCAFNTSMEVAVRVGVENVLTGERTLCCTAYFVFVTLPVEGKKPPVPKLVPQTAEEVREYALAAERKQIRLQRKRTIDKAVLEEQERLERLQDEVLHGNVPDSKSVTDASVQSLAAQSSDYDHEASSTIPVDVESIVTESRSCGQSHCESTQLVLPPHANQSVIVSLQI